MRFVAVWTLRGGVLEKPEPLDDANQWRAYTAWRMDASRDVRAAFELEHDDARVAWNRAFDGHGYRMAQLQERRPRVNRLMAVAERARIS